MNIVTFAKFRIIHNLNRYDRVKISVSDGTKISRRAAVVIVINISISGSHFRCSSVRTSTGSSVVSNTRSTDAVVYTISIRIKIITSTYTTSNVISVPLELKSAL